MPSLSESIGQDLSGYGPVPEGSSGPQVAASQPNQMPANSGFTRSPLPILSQQGDVTRLFYGGTGVMQIRTLNIQKPPTVVDLTAQSMAKAAQAQAQAATSTARAAARTATGSGFTTGSNSNGSFTKNPIGGIDQSNTLSITTSPATISFATPFTNAASINVQVTPMSTGGSGDWVNLVSGSVTTNTFEVVAVTLPMMVSWRATGS